MAWNDKLSVGIDEIDADHKKIIAIINELFDGINAGCSKNLLEGILDQLVEYTQIHFAREKQLFAVTAYSEAEAHEREHAKMEAWALKTRAEFKAGTLAAPSLEVMNYLKDWLFEHILISDLQYAPYLKAMAVCY
jgi:hemerythrin